MKKRVLVIASIALIITVFVAFAMSAEFWAQKIQTNIITQNAGGLRRLSHPI